jgi:RNA polymerase sigma-54 factor
VSNAIVERQKNFFVHGELAMRPLVLREIADELGLHESTISRVTTAKYMATPFGTFELKYFFGSGLGTETGGNASSTAVRALIKQFVAAESPAKPLSDNQISDMLKEQGIECARRTVAKYREALKIAPANPAQKLRPRACVPERPPSEPTATFLPCAAGVEDFWPMKSTITGCRARTC